MFSVPTPQSGVTITNGVRWSRNQQGIEMVNKRTCPQCDQVVYYGIYCSNVCADKGYRQWKEGEPERIKQAIMKRREDEDNATDEAV